VAFLSPRRAEAAAIESANLMFGALQVEARAWIASEIQERIDRYPRVKTEESQPTDTYQTLRGKLTAFLTPFNDMS